MGLLIKQYSIQASQAAVDPSVKWGYFCSYIRGRFYISAGLATASIRTVVYIVTIRTLDLSSLSYI